MKKKTNILNTYTNDYNRHRLLGINIYEGMKVQPFHIIIWCIPFLIIAIITSGTISVIFWILFAILLFDFTFQLRSRLRHPWCRVHYPIMYRYAKALGNEMALSKKEKRSLYKENAAKELLYTIYKNKTEEELSIYIEIIKDNYGKENDINNISSVIAKTEVEKVKIEDELKVYFAKQEWSEVAPYVIIADCVEKCFGVNERARYLIAAMNGQAA